MNAKLKWTVLILVLALGGVVAAKMLFLRKAGEIDTDPMRARGLPQAKVQVVEFIDLQCPACANGARILKEYTDKYPQDLRVQVKYFPLVQAHAHAMPAALYAECAAQQGKFWEFTEPLLARQTQWSGLISADPMFRQVAKEARVDMGRLDACLTSEEARRVIKDDETLGKSLGVQSTPTYFINNKMVVGIKILVDELTSRLGPK